MKKIVYLITFVILGVVIQFLIHAVVEIWYINLLLQDFSRYDLGLTWEQWFMIHHLSSIILLIIGMVFGFWQGKFWWRRIYEQDKYESK